jgi:hypothetical protein
LRVRIDVKRVVARSHWRVGWREFSARWFRYVDRRWVTDAISSRCATG